MANVIGNGSITQIADIDGDPITSTNRLPVETEAEGFKTWVSYPDFAAVTGTSQALNHASHTAASITDAKEILIQADDGNAGFVMIGGTQGTTLAGAAGSRAGIKLTGGQILVLAIASFASVFIIGSEASQYVNVAYFK